MKAIPSLLTTILLVLAAGCAVGPDYERPDTGLSETSGEEDPVPDPVAWWSRFEDPVLDQLLQATMAGNHTLEAGRLRILKARAQLSTAESANRPSLSLGASVIRQERSENSLFPVLENTPGFPDRTETLIHAGFDASWEIDLFGSNRSTIEASQLQVKWSELALHDLQATLLGETGRLYYTWLALNHNVENLRRTIAIQGEIIDVVTTRYKAGTVSELEPARAESRLRRLQASLPSILAERDAVLGALSTLTVTPRDTLQAMLEGPQSLPQVEAFMGDRLESPLLQRRPDIRMAELRVRQANSELGARVANLYPRFVLVGSLGLESVDTGSFADSASRFWRLGPSLTLPILEGGRLRGRVKMAEADLQIRVSQYHEQVLRALEESGTALVRFQRGLEEREFIEQAYASADEALETARRQYEAGVIPLDVFLGVQEDRLALQDQLVRIRSQCAINLISLGKSLGGSWDFSN